MRSHASCTRSYIRTAVALSIETTIALPAKAAPDEVADEVLRDPSQPLRPGDELVLAARSGATSVRSWLVVELGLLEDLVQLLVEVLVVELELGMRFS